MWVVIVNINPKNETKGRKILDKLINHSGVKELAAFEQADDLSMINLDANQSKLNLGKFIESRHEIDRKRYFRRQRHGRQRRRSR